MSEKHTDTPRTDKAEKMQSHWGDWVPDSFARKLERELGEADATREEAESALGLCYVAIGYGHPGDSEGVSPADIQEAVERYVKDKNDEITQLSAVAEGLAGQLEQWRAWLTKEVGEQYMPRLRPTIDALAVYEAWKGGQNLSPEFVDSGAKIPMTADGFPIYLGHTLFTQDPDQSYSTDDTIIEITVIALYDEVGFDCYNGTFTVGGADFESGNLDFYALRKNVPRDDLSDSSLPTPQAEQEFRIPDIGDERLAELSAKIRPIVIREGVLMWIESPHPRSESMLYDPKYKHEAKGVVEIGTIRTLHSYAYYGFFKPSVAEVLAQIPDEWIRKTVAFSVHGPQDSADLNKDRDALNAGFQVATTTLYGIEQKENPQAEQEQQEGDIKACILSQLLAAQIQKYQPFTNCRRAIERVIEEADALGLIHDYAAILRVAPKHSHKQQFKAQTEQQQQDGGDLKAGHIGWSPDYKSQPDVPLKKFACHVPLSSELLRMADAQRKPPQPVMISLADVLPLLEVLQWASWPGWASSNLGAGPLIEAREAFLAKYPQITG